MQLRLLKNRCNKQLYLLFNVKFKSFKNNKVNNRLKLNNQ